MWENLIDYGHFYCTSYASFVFLVMLLPNYLNNPTNCHYLWHGWPPTFYSRLRCIEWDISRSFLLRLGLTIFSIVLIFTMAQVNAVSSLSSTPFEWEMHFATLFFSLLATLTLSATLTSNAWTKALAIVGALCHNMPCYLASSASWPWPSFYGCPSWSNAFSWEQWAWFMPSSLNCPINPYSRVSTPEWGEWWMVSEHFQSDWAVKESLFRRMSAYVQDDTRLEMWYRLVG